MIDSSGFQNRSWGDSSSSLKHVCKNAWPKISIITPSYNQGQYIEQTILSVINQKYPNLEYIIIDGGSTDNTVEIIKKYEKHITYWVSEPDRGQSHAINKGLERCTGDVFNWLNSDDYYAPEALIKVGEAFTNSDTYVLAGRERRINKHGQEVGISKGTTIMANLSETIGKCHIDQPSTFFRLSTLKPLLPLDETFHYLMDGELWLRYLLYWGQDQVEKTNSVLVNFRLHETSKTVSSYQKFQVDKNTFENNLVEDFAIEESIKDVLLDRKARDFRKKLEIKQKVDENVITSFFCARSVEQFYEENDYEQAKRCLTYIKDNYPFLLSNHANLNYYKRILLIPTVLLQKARRLKTTVYS